MKKTFSPPEITILSLQDTDIVATSYPVEKSEVMKVRTRDNVSEAPWNEVSPFSEGSEIWFD